MTCFERRNKVIFETIIPNQITNSLTDIENILKGRTYFVEGSLGIGWYLYPPNYLKKAMCILIQF